MQDSGANRAAGKSRIYEFGPFRLDSSAHALYRDEAEVPLPPTLFDLLSLLVEAGGQTVGKDRFMAAVWAGSIVEEGSLTRSVSRLRAILGEGGADERYIATVARRGYRFVAPIRAVARDSVVATAAADNAAAGLESAAVWIRWPLDATCRWTPCSRARSGAWKDVIASASG